ncbi:hypothetical protein GCM10010415_67310 [Streptomyces atrovirens]
MVLEASDLDRDRHPHRGEVVAHLTAHTDRPKAGIRTRRRVTSARRAGSGFEVALDGGGRLAARAVVAAQGTFGRPYRPAPPGLERFTGQVPHAADHRRPVPSTGGRVVAAGTRNGSPGAWPPASRAGDGPRRTGSTYVNIDACRMRRCCRCSSPPTARAWRRAAHRWPNAR